MKVLLKILGLIALVIAAFLLLAVAQMFTPKHADTSTNATGISSSLKL